MKKRTHILPILILLLLAMVTDLNAQVRIGKDNQEPHGGALLDLGTGGGLLLPRINIGDVSVFGLNGDKDSAKGLMVYNLNESITGGDGKGVYVWDGAKWKAVNCLPPATPGAITLSASTINLNATFTATVAAVSGATAYEWTLPSGLTGTSTTNSITIKGATAGTYAVGTISVKAKNDCGTSAAKASAGAVTVRVCAAAPATPGAITLSASAINLNATFTASVAAVSGATAYEWTLPSGLTGTSTTNSITIKGATAGTYAAGTISVKAKNTCGTSAAKASTTAVTVRVCAAAPATPGAITLSASAINLNATFTASVAAVSGATAYEWTLPSGLTGTSTTNSITIKGATAGTYAVGTISVKAKNTCGTSAAKASTTAVTVRVCAAAPATPGAITLSASTINLNATFTASIAAVSGATAYEWTLPSGLTGTSTTNSITIKGATAGTYAAGTISVKAKNTCGTSAAKASTTAVTVRVCAAAPATPGAITLSASAINLNATFTASVAAVSGATAYEWTLPSGLTGTSTTNSITIKGATAGTYAAGTISVKAKNTCGTSAAKASTTAVTVRVCAAAPAQPGAITLSKTMVDLNATFTASVTAVSGATAYEWTLPSGLTGTSTTNSITIKGATVGTYAAGTISVKAKNTCGTGTARATTSAVKVVAACTTLPVVSISSNPAPASVTEGATVTLTASATGGGALTYKWYKNGTAMSNTTASISITATKKDYYTCEIKNTCGTGTSGWSLCGANTANGWLAFLCHNLGADTTKDPFTYSEDILGDLYQWGRVADGHQARRSSRSMNPANSDDLDDRGQIKPTSLKYGCFIYSGDWGNDWTNYPNNKFWGDGTDTSEHVKKTNLDPCPPGWKVPSIKNWIAVRDHNLDNITWVDKNIAIIGGTLPLPLSGWRDGGDGSVYLPKTDYTKYWSSSTGHDRYAQRVFLSAGIFGGGSILTNGDYRYNGMAVRCMAE